MAVAVVAAAAGDDHRPRPHRAHHRHVGELAAGVAEGVADRDDRGMLVGPLHDRGGDRREVRVGDVVDQHPDDVAVPRCDRAGRQVGAVPEVGRGTRDPLDQLVGDAP